MNLIALNPWHVVDPSADKNNHRFYRQQEVEWLPPVDIFEDEASFSLLMDLPGFAKENVDIRVENQQIQIVGFRAPPEKGALKYTERVHGKFTRNFSIPAEANPGGINAQFENGVLIIQIPKAAKALPKKILIEAKS